MKKILVYKTLFLLCLLSACEKEKQLDLGEQDDPRLVVESFLTDEPNQPQWVKLTTTISYYNTENIPSVSKASVRVEEGQNTWNFNESTHKDSAGYFLAPAGFSVDSGATHKLEIDWNESTYLSTSPVNPVPTLDSLHLQLDPFQFIIAEQQGEEVEDTTINVVAHFSDLPGRSDYYYFDLFLNGKLISTSASEKTVIDDQGLQANAQLAVQSFDLNEINFMDTLTLRIQGVDKICYEFYQSFGGQSGGGPFGGAPPANVPTNISGEARGLFQVSMAERRDLVLDATAFAGLSTP